MRGRMKKRMRMRVRAISRQLWRTSRPHAPGFSLQSMIGLVYGVLSVHGFKQKNIRHFHAG